MKIPVHVFPSCIDFNPFMDKLEKLHGFDHRDFAGKWKNDVNYRERPYQDFWHWCLDKPFGELHRGGPNFLSDEYLTDPETPDWVKTILKYIFDVCEGHPARVEDGIWFHVDW